MDGTSPVVHYYKNNYLYMDEFFPADYSVPTSGGAFMKLEKGENLFRFLDKVTMGYEYWTVNNKPVRSFTEFKDFPSRTDAKKNDKGEAILPKHVWVAPVWDHKDGKIKIINIPQQSVQKAILSFGKDADWRNPMEYDIRVTRSGDKFDTEYAISPKPKKEVDASVLEMYQKEKENLQKTIAEMFTV